MKFRLVEDFRSNDTFYRLEIADAWGDNCGGLFNSRALWNIIYDEDSEDEEEVIELESAIEELQSKHKVPDKWIDGKVKFAFKKSFFIANQELIKKIDDLLNFYDHSLIVNKIEPKQIVFEDSDQIAYLVEEFLNEASIDPDGKYTDYGTGKVTSDNIFDDKTHVSFYDQILTNPKYMAEEENLKGHIEMLSPREYYEICATKIFRNSSVESLKRSRAADPRVLDEIKDIIVKYKRQVFLPYLNYAEKNQEGLHRMLVAAELFGWDHKFPVLIIEWADEELAQRRAKEKEDNRIRLKIKDAVQKALNYTFDNMKEFEEEAKAQVDYTFDFADEKVKSFSIEHNNDETTDVEVNGIVYQFDTELIHIEPREKDDEEILWDDMELDDLDIDLDDLDMDEFMKKYGIG